MRQPFSHKSDFRPGGLWLLVYGGLAVIESALPHFLSVKSSLFALVQIALLCLLGLFSLYTGMKKFHQRQERQPQARWYTQPSILVALGLFFTALVLLFLLALGVTTLDLSLWALVLIPAWICWLAAMIFLVRNWRTPKTL
jgi:uncharacterized membrane protein